MTTEPTTETGTAVNEATASTAPLPNPDTALAGQLANNSWEDISSLLHPYQVLETAKAGKILDVDMIRKRLSVELTDGSHALVSAPDSFFATGSNANVGDFYVVDTSGIPHHVHESLFGKMFTKLTGIMEGSLQS